MYGIQAHQYVRKLLAEEYVPDRFLRAEISAAVNGVSVHRDRIQTPERLFQRFADCQQNQILTAVRPVFIQQNQYLPGAFRKHFKDLPAILLTDIIVVGTHKTLSPTFNTVA